MRKIIRTFRKMCNYILPNLAGLFFVLFAYFLLFSRSLTPVCKTCNEYFDTVFYQSERFFPLLVGGQGLMCICQCVMTLLIVFPPLRPVFFHFHKLLSHSGITVLINRLINSIKSLTHYFYCVFVKLIWDCATRGSCYSTVNLFRFLW